MTGCLLPSEKMDYGDRNYRTHLQIMLRNSHVWLIGLAFASEGGAQPVYVPVREVPL